MARYINADKAIDKIHALRIKYMTDHKDIDNPFNIFWECCDSILQTPTADVQAFFTEDEIALINEYKDEVKAIDFKTAILNAVSVALDKVYWQNVFANKPTDSAPTADVREIVRGEWIRNSAICLSVLSVIKSSRMML
jgi:hypothetical protein